MIFLSLLQFYSTHLACSTITTYCTSIGRITSSVVIIFNLNSKCRVNIFQLSWSLRQIHKEELSFFLVLLLFARAKVLRGFFFPSTLRKKCFMAGKCLFYMQYIEVVYVMWLYIYETISLCYMEMLLLCCVEILSSIALASPRTSWNDPRWYFNGIPTKKRSLSSELCNPTKYMNMVCNCVVQVSFHGRSQEIWREMSDYKH